MLKDLFKNEKFVFIFTFAVSAIFYYLFEFTSITGEYILADIGLAPTFGLIFGPVGALGQAFSTLVCELVTGMDPIASFIDFGIMFFISFFAYKLWYTTFKSYGINAPRFNSIYNILKFLAIIILTSIVYWALINISFYAYQNMSPVYPLTIAFERISYILNNFIFSIILGLFFISSFNTLKIPLKIPQKRISRINIPYKYFLIPLAILIAYLILTISSIIDNDYLENIFFASTVIVSVLFCLNTFDYDVEVKTHNYSIIEQVILIFLIILGVNLIINFEYFRIISHEYFNELATEFRYLITIAFSTTLTILLSLIHIHYVEKNITNPLYGLIDSVRNYRDETTGSKLIKYSKSDDDVGVLVKTFIQLSENIKMNFDKITEVTAKKERIETELNVANDIQSNMIPRNFKEFSKGKPFEIYGYMNPAREVGGDFYDYFSIDDDEIHFIIGDVSSKGMPATLFMVKTMHLIKNHSKFSKDLSKTMEGVNDILCERNKENQFVTIWFGKLNFTSGKLTYVNAGHNPPLIKRDNGNFEYLNDDPNLVVGIMEDMPYEKHEITLNKGDTIFLYTDGITDANDIDENFYGEKRLKETINKHKNAKPMDIINEINTDIDRFCESQEQYDDMTMLVVKYEGVN